MKYCSEIIESICKDIENGLPQKQAAIINGVGESTFYEWVKEKPEFAESVKKALSTFMKKHIQRINIASNKSWQASAWMLERRFKDEYATKNNIDITTSGEPIQIVFKEVADNI